MIDVSCLNRGSKVKRPRAGLGVHFPQSDFRDSSEKVSGLRTNNMAEETACLRVLQHLHRSRDLHVHAYSKWSSDIVLRLKPRLNETKANALWYMGLAVWNSPTTKRPNVLVASVWTQ